MSIQETAARKAANGQRLSLAEALYLYENVGLLDLASWARQAKIRQSGNKVYYNINRHINLSNICTASCPLCAFSCEEGDRRGFMLTKEDVIAKIKETIATVKGLTEIHIVSSLHPHNDFNYYIEILQTIKELLPHVHIQAFTPVEIVHFAKISGKSVKDVLIELQSSGLASLPGGGAEILVDRVRRLVSPKKIMTDDWLSVMKTAHSIGMESTATMVLGLGETVEERIEHMRRIRELQDETGGFRAFIMWTFQPGNTQLGGSKFSSWEYLKTLAVSRLYFDNVSHIQGSWVTQGQQIGQITLAFGADDLGSIMLEENVVRAAGTAYQMSIDKMVHTIETADRQAAQRDTQYNIIRRF